MTHPTLLLSRADVADLLDPAQLLDVLAKGFEAISRGEGVSAPPRGELTVGDAGRLLVMPAHLSGLASVTKLVSVFPGNVRSGIPSHMSLVVLMDEATGAALAIMDAEHITAMRTAGAAALAARLLARPEAKVMTILGAGVQGQAHLELVAAQFDLDTILVASRARESAERLAAGDSRAEAVDDVEAAVRRADIVCLCSGSAEPLIREAWIAPGQHISSVGFAPPGGELDPAIAARHRLFVEARIAFAPAPAGCAELAGIDPGTACELGELLLGLKPGRTSRDEVTVYKAMGHAVEDLVVANMVYHGARAVSAGRPFPF